MAGNKQNKVAKGVKNKATKYLDVYNKYCNAEFSITFLTDPQYTIYIGWFLIVLEVILNVAIVHNVNYTEIDWKAYMQECEGFLNGTWDYSQLKGDTGPLVYPAGFVYIYSAFYYLTTFGTDIRLAQYLFIGVYTLQLWLTFRIFALTRKIPPYALLLVTLTSYRIHSVYVLRLFNDPIAVLFVYASLNAFLAGRWWLGSSLYSLAVSIKMNALLYAPCLLLLYLTSLGFKKTLSHISWCAMIQLLLGAPFLLTNPLAYIGASFDLGRVFDYKWTVNYRFLARDTFENRFLHVALLTGHVFLLFLYLPMAKRYLNSYAKLKLVEADLKPQMSKATLKRNKIKAEKDDLSYDQQKFLDAYETGLKQRSGAVTKVPQEPQQPEYSINFDSVSQLFILPFFVTNLIGVACARSLHYQFYSWYFHSLLYLVHCTGYSRPVMYLILAVIEYCWNCYPSTVLSSISLHFCHALLLIGLYRTMRR